MILKVIARRALFGGMMALPIILLACATGPAHFRRNFDVTDTFENYQLLSGYQYYYNGLEASPIAVVGIQKGYSLASPIWHAVEMDRAKLRRMVNNMLNTPDSEYNIDPNGADIFNDDGKVIGVWYSVWAFPILTFKSDTEFAISQPMTVFPLSNRHAEERISSPIRRDF